jgi:hypothetical protein
MRRAGKRNGQDFETREVKHFPAANAAIRDAIIRLTLDPTVFAIEYS